MLELRERFTNVLFPAILLAFFALYATSLLTGTEPEVGLFRAGLASALLAVLGRVTMKILDDLPAPEAEGGPAGSDDPPVGEQVDALIGDEPTAASTPLADLFAAQDDDPPGKE